MSAKLKSPKNSWGKCRLCQCVIPSQESSSHLNIYHGSDPEQQQTTPKRDNHSRESGHGYIRQNIVHGFVKELPNKGNDIEKLVPQSQLDELVFMHPSTMSMCEISMGDWVTVWRNDNSKDVSYVFLKAWPLNIPGSTTGVMMSRHIRQLLTCEINDVIHIRKIHLLNRIPATAVKLAAREERCFYEKPEFLKYFVRTYDGKLITQGSSLFINYLGQNCFLTVTNVEYDSLSNSTSIETQNNIQYESEISYNMENLDIKSNVELDLDIKDTPPKTTVQSLCLCDKTQPNVNGKFFYIHHNTKIRINASHLDLETGDLKTDSVTFEDIGGLSKQLGEIQELLNLPAEENETFFRYGLTPPKGILLFGPSGTGKSLVAKAIRCTTDQTFIAINAPDLFSKYYGESESKLRAIFEDAKHRAPSIIFIDNIDCLCPKRNGSGTRQEQRVLSTLLSLMDNLPSNAIGRTVIIAATNNLDSLDSALRRAGRLDREIEIGIPTEYGRAEILNKIFRRIKHNLSNDDLKSISKNLHGYVGADLAAVCTQAGFCSLKRQLQDSTNKGLVTYEDIAAASKLVKPSAMREILIEVPTVRWVDVGGQDELKHKLKQAVEWPLKCPEALERMGITPTKGILMYGPPGCSKTLIAKALATESGLNFIAIKGPELFNKWVGESERAVREVFRKARSVAPSIVFFDEIDALAANRGGSSGGSNVSDRVLAQVLTEMDGLQPLEGVTIVAATNRPDMIDKALLRPGRLDRIVYVSLPDSPTRADIFRIQFRRIPVADDVSIEYLAAQTEGYSGAEIVAVCREAALKAMEESFDATQVSASHFESTLKTVKPRTSKSTIKFYEDYLKSGSGKN